MLVTLLLQLLFAGLMPAADARAYAADTGTAAGVHMEKPGVHHPVHDSEDCAFCIIMQAGATPAAPVRAPDTGLTTRVAAPAERASSHAPAPLFSEHARAPPIL